MVRQVDLRVECRDVQNMVSDSWFLPFIETVHLKIDEVLISALFERFYPETNIFHLPFGEMMITLQDVKHITGLPIEGLVVTGTSSCKLKLEGVLKLLKDTLELATTHAKSV